MLALNRRRDRDGKIADGRLHPVHRAADVTTLQHDAKLPLHVAGEEILKHGVAPAQAVGAVALEQDVRADRAALLAEKLNQLVVNDQDVGLNPGGQNVPFVNLSRGSGAKPKQPLEFGSPVSGLAVIIRPPQNRRPGEDEPRRGEEDENAEKNLHVLFWWGPTTFILLLCQDEVTKIRHFRNGFSVTQS
jgi:hypothetical protein